MLFDALNHVAIICSDLHQSVDFYTKILGFQEFHRIERPERESTIIYLDAGSCIIELFSFPNPPERLSYPEARGLRHIAFSVRDFDQVLTELEAQSIDHTPIQIDARTSQRMTFIFDPDKLPIEICEVTIPSE